MAKLDMEPDRLRGWDPEGIMGVADEPPEVWGLRLGLLAPLRLVGEGEGAGLMELEEWPSECNEPVDWYIVDLQMVRCDYYLRTVTVWDYVASVTNCIFAVKEAKLATLVFVDFSEETFIGKEMKKYYDWWWEMVRRKIYQNIWLSKEYQK